MNYSRWLSTVAICTLIFSSPFIYIISYNYYVDPLWNFNHHNAANESQVAFDERQLKVNYIAQKNVQYDSLLLGTSRTTYINQHDFTNMNVYNFSASLLSLEEYGPYIQYATEQNGKDFETIMLEVYPTNLLDEAIISQYPEPSTYFETNKETLYQFKSLFSLDTFDKAKTNASDEEPSGFRIYDRNNVVSMKPIDQETVNANIEKGLKRVTPIIEEMDYSEYKKALVAIKETSPNSEFILYSPPFFHERTVKIFNSDVGIDQYREWLEVCIEVFGGVVNFSTVNDISLNAKNYFDTNHFYPETGTHIAQDIVAFENGDNMKYATYVTKDNLEEFMQQFEEDLRKYE